MDLSELGLSQYEQQAYASLLRLSKATASEISRDSGVVYGKIYEVLARLESKGLVVVIPDKTKLFVPGDPKELAKLVKKKQQALLTLENQVKDFQLQYTQREEEPVVLARGKKAWPKVLKLHREAKEFAYGVRSKVEIRPDTLRNLKRQLKHGIDARNLLNYRPVYQKNANRIAKLGGDTRKYSGSEVSLSITDKEVLIILIQSNTNVLIRDKAFILLMKDMFEALHGKCERIQS